MPDEMFGLDSTVTSGGYFLMADVFLLQNKPDIAHSLYTEVGTPTISTHFGICLCEMSLIALRACVQVADLWHVHLCKLMDGISQSGTQPGECFGEWHKDRKPTQRDICKHYSSSQYIHFLCEILICILFKSLSFKKLILLG